MKIGLLSAVFLSAFLAVSCYSPNPIYGKWADNNGNQISFNSDLTCSATINVGGTNTMYDGAYQVIENVMIFTWSSGLSMNTEWDIRGSILYLTWTEGSETIQLSLYHTAK